MMPSPDRVPDWLLERLAAGELPAAQAARLRQRLAEAGQTDRLTALADSNAEILRALPAEQVAAEVQRRARQPVAKRGQAWTRPLWALSLAAAGATVLVLTHKPATTQDPLAQLDPEEVRVKGQLVVPALDLYRQGPKGIERLGPTSRLRPGDLVQLRYLAAGKRFGVVASMDARGSLTLHLPETAGPAVTLAPGGWRALTHSYELDDSPGYERFVFVTSDAPFDTAPVMNALKQGQALPNGLTLWSVTLAKETP